MSRVASSQSFPCCSGWPKTQIPGPSRPSTSPSEPSNRRPVRRSDRGHWVRRWGTCFSPSERRVTRLYYLDPVFQSPECFLGCEGRVWFGFPRLLRPLRAEHFLGLDPKKLYMTFWHRDVTDPNKIFTTLWEGIWITKYVQTVARLRSYPPRAV